MATTSTSAGHDQMQASTTVAVGSTTPNGPVALTRTTGSASPGHGNSANANKLWISTSVINESGGADITGQTVTGPVSVHDVFKAGSNAGGVQPTGHVSFMFFTNGTCTGTPASTEAGVNPAHPGIEADGTATSPTHSIAAAGDYCFKAQYTADPNYPDGFTDIEPFHVTITPSQPPVRDANIQITPPTAGNPVKTNHTLTAHVNVNTGGGFVNAPDGTTITFTLTNSGGATPVFVDRAAALTTGGTGSCSVVISSPTAGTTTVSAATDVVVNGVSLHRVTDATATNSGPDEARCGRTHGVSTDIINTSNAVVTTVQAGTTIRDFVRVSRDPNTSPSVPNPTGTVVFHRYTTARLLGDADEPVGDADPGQSVNGDVGRLYADVEHVVQRGVPRQRELPPGDGRVRAADGHADPASGDRDREEPEEPRPSPRAGRRRSRSRSRTPATSRCTDVHVDDPLAPGCNRTKADIPALALMAPGASVTYTCVQPNVQSDFTNVATATGTPPTGPDVTASDMAPVTTATLKPAPKPKPKPVVHKKKKPKMVSHKKPKVTG